MAAGQRDPRRGAVQHDLVAGLSPGIFERDGVLHLVDGDVYSSETPWVKPRPEIFLAAAAAVGADPSACVYVGDRSYEDVHGPQSVGMRAVWIPFGHPG